ncbi:MAG: YcxB family protein [Chloroflexota bacterium]
MSETYTVTYEITAAAMADAARLLQAAFAARYRVAMVVVAVTGVVVAVAVSPLVGVPITVVGIVLLLTWEQITDRWLYRRAARGIIGSTCVCVADDEGLHVQDPLGSSVIAWPALTQVRSNDKTVVFVRDRVLTAYVPTAAFTSLAERDSFLTFARARVGTVA